jgi:hypothetical protein
VAQIKVTRLEPGASGNIHFSMKAFGLSPSLTQSLTRDVYESYALVPPSPWLADSAPPEPQVSAKRGSKGWELRLTPPDKTVVRLWTVRWRDDAGWQSTVLPSTRRSIVLDDAHGAVVTAVDRVGLESPPVIVGLLESRGQTP